MWRRVNHRFGGRSDDPVFRLASAVAVALVLALAGGSRDDGRSQGAGLRAQGSGADQAQSRGTFAAQIAALSEPGGYFDTDNLVSNERAYLSVLPELSRRHVRGGAYIGVGPDQNFSYIADIRPSIAFIVDIRRDNLLIHLLFKALFQQAGSRIEYLAMLFGRPAPPEFDGWRDVAISRLTEYVRRPALDVKSLAALRLRLDEVVKEFGVPLSAADLGTIGRFHRRFVEKGLALQFQSAGRPPQDYYPTYEQLLLETDGEGRQRNYLASEESFQFVKALQARDRVIPIVGNLSGPSALPGIGRAIGGRGETLSAFYASNVEFYLERDGSYLRFIANVSGIPRTPRSVIIRSIFGRGGGRSLSVVQNLNELVSSFAVSR